MNQHLLKYLIPLQPMIKKAMGEIQKTDKFYIDGEEWFSISVFRDDCICGMSKTNWRRNFCYDDPAIVLIPLTIDDSSPEASKRSLWGMVDWSQFSLGQWGVDGQIILRDLVRHKDIKGAPTEAILKALCHQEGVEVK